jgi:NTE family protein
MPRRPAAAPRAINLALQGGGSHGAYTWGVLDALLEHGRLAIEGITGTSSGAINAVVLVEGWRRARAAGRDGAEGARESLAAFWERLAAHPSVFSLAPGAGGSGEHPMALWMDLVSRVWAPTQFNPLDYNPLRSALAETVDFDALRADCPFRLFLCATRVDTGRARIFREHELTLEMPLASAALPYSFHAVQIEGASYWDGGFVGNPALWPLFYSTRSRDLLLVQVNPLRRDELPRSAQEIVDRSAEISFNATLLAEMRALAFVQRLLQEGSLDARTYKDIRVHLITGDAALAGFGADSKYATAPAFLRRLGELGREDARAWLARHARDVGRRSSVDVIKTFL